MPQLQERFVAALDIGSARTTALIAEVVGDQPKQTKLKVKVIEPLLA